MASRLGRNERSSEAYSVQYVEERSDVRTTADGIFSSPRQAEVAELADALDSGSSARKGVRVQIPASAPTQLLSYFCKLESGRLLVQSKRLTALAILSGSASLRMAGLWQAEEG